MKEKHIIKEGFSMRDSLPKEVVDRMYSMTKNKKKSGENK